MYIYLYSMILSHISLQNYFENFPKSRKFPYSILFQAWRSAVPVDRIHSRLGRSTGRSIAPCVQDVHVLCTSIGRPTGRPTESSLLSVFWPVDRFGRPIAQNVFPLWRPVDRPVDRVQRLVANQTAGRPVRSTDSRLQPPTASF